MEIITDIASLRTRLKYESSTGFVPTMGNLHEGHLSLVRTAQEKTRCIVVSIFVNRLQFGPTEDFDQYPRTLADDCELLENQGVDIAFVPAEKSLYPIKQEFMLDPPPLANTLEGEFRPGFFQGVSTVVLKLLNIVQPDVAVFGKKDYQQLHLMREMVRQLNLSVEVADGETIRATDGLALSSRNRYLTHEERAKATRLYRVLSQVRQAVEGGNSDFNELEENAKEILRAHGWKVDYVAIRRRDTLAPTTKGDRNMVVLGAATLGKTRLIDNLEIDAKT